MRQSVVRAVTRPQVPGSRRVLFTVIVELWHSERVPACETSTWYDLSDHARRTLCEGRRRFGSGRRVTRERLLVESACDFLERKHLAAMFARKLHSRAL